MDNTNRDNQIEIFRNYWGQLLLSNKLQVCTEILKDTSILDVNILRIIYVDSSVIPKEIAKILGIPNSSLTNAINRLVKNKLLERKLNENDLRSFKLELTTEGKKAIQEHFDGERELIGNMFLLLDEKEIDVLLDVIKKLASYL